MLDGFIGQREREGGKGGGGGGGGGAREKEGKSERKRAQKLHVFDMNLITGKNRPCTFIIAPI